MSTEQKLDRLLTTLDVRIHAFARCEIRKGSCLVFQPMNAVVVHYVLAGKGVLFILLIRQHLARYSSAFSRAFRRAYGSDPSALRNLGRPIDPPTRLAPTTPE